MTHFSDLKHKAHFIIPATDTDFLAKLKKYKGPRILTIRRKGRGGPRPHSSHHTPVDVAPLWAIYFEDQHEKDLSHFHYTTYIKDQEKYWAKCNENTDLLAQLKSSQAMQKLDHKLYATSVEHELRLEMQMAKLNRVWPFLAFLTFTLGLALGHLI